MLVLCCMEWKRYVSSLLYSFVPKEFHVIMLVVLLALTLICSSIKGIKVNKFSKLFISSQRISSYIVVSYLPWLSSPILWKGWVFRFICAVSVFCSIKGIGYYFLHLWFWVNVNCEMIFLRALLAVVFLC